MRAMQAAALAAFRCGGLTRLLGLAHQAALGNAALQGFRQFGSGLGFDSASVPKLDVKGKAFLITGATSGIGLATANSLAQHQATVLVHGRNKSRVQRTLRDIRASTNNQLVFGYTYDLASLDASRELAAHVRRDVDAYFGGQLAVVINNAGVFMEELQHSPEGLEMTWAVNVASPFLLTAELLDVISERIINVSSISLADTLDFNNIQQEKGWDRMGHAAYGASKLGITMWTYKLARMLKQGGSPVIANCVDPGTVDTKLLYHGWGEIAHVALPPEEADDEFWAATHPAAAVETGMYYVNKKKRQSPKFSYDEQAQERLWRVLESQTGARVSV